MSYSDFNETDLHQIVILNRVSNSVLMELIGLMSLFQGIPGLLMMVERLNHSEQVKDFRQAVIDQGHIELDKIANYVKDDVCNKWQYCKRRSTGGFGDPRTLSQALAPVVEVALKDAGVIPSKTYLMLACVCLARFPLSRLCECSNTTGSADARRKEE